MLHVLLIPSQRFVAEDNRVGGIFQLDLALALQRSGLKVGVVAPMARSLRGWTISEFGRRRTWMESNDQGVPIFRPDHYAWIPSRMPYAATWYQIRLGTRLFDKYVERYGVPDILHAHNALFAGAVANSLKMKLGIPYVLTEHSSAHITRTVTWWQSKTLSSALENADRRLVVSKYLARTMEDLYGDVMRPWTWLPNVVSAEFAVAELPGPPAQGSSFRFLNIGAMLPWKNHAGLLRAFALSFKGRRDVLLRIAGEGPQLEPLQRLSHELGIQEQVTFLGGLSRTEIVEEFRGSHAFVLPSDFETFGVVLIEALAMGRPVIATDCGGPREIVNKDNGLLVPVGDVEALAGAMHTMVEQRHRYSPDSLRRACIAEYGEQTIIARHKAIYESVIG